MGEIIEAIDELINIQKEIVQELKELIETVEKHHRDSNISRSVGVGVGIIGVALIPWTFGLSLLATAAGAAMSVGVSIADIIKSNEFSSKVSEEISRQDDAADDLKTKLKNLEGAVKTYQDLMHCTEEEALIVIFSAVVGKACTLGGSAKGIYQAYQLQKLATDVAVMAKEGCSIGFNAGFRIPAGASAAGASATARVGRAGVEAATKVMRTTTAAVLSVVGVAIDLGFMIKGWTTDHPTLEGIQKTKDQVESSIEELNNLRQHYSELQDIVLEAGKISDEIQP